MKRAVGWQRWLLVAVLWVVIGLGVTAWVPDGSLYWGSAGTGLVLVWQSTYRWRQGRLRERMLRKDRLREEARRR